MAASARGASLAAVGGSAGVLRVEVLGARRLQPAVLGSLLKWTPSFSNPFAVVSLRGEAFATKVVNRELNPTWKELGSLNVPLPTEQDVLQTVGGVGGAKGGGTGKLLAKKLLDIPTPPNSTGSVVSDGGSYREYQPCAPELVVEVFHRDEEHSSDGEVTAPGLDTHQTENFRQPHDKLLGAVVVPLLPCLLSAASSYRAWYSLVDDQFQDAGQIQLALNFDVGGLEPHKGDVIRLAGFGGAEYYSKLLPPTARLEVIDLFQDQVLVQTKSREGWSLSFEMHRNLVHVEHRPSLLRDASTQLQGQMIRARHSSAFVAGQKLWRALPDLQREQLARSYKFSSYSSAQVYQALVESANATKHDGIYAGVGALLTGSADATRSVQHEFVRVYWTEEEPNFGPAKARGRIFAAFTPADKLALDDQGDYSVYDESDTSEEESDELVSENGDVPDQLICPITGCPMVDPVVAADGHSYERAAILQWLTTSDKSPMTGTHMTTTEVFPNYTLRQLSEEFQATRRRRHGRRDQSAMDMGA